MSKRFLTTTEVATILGISRVAVFKKIKRGQLAAEKVGNRYLVDPRQLGIHYKKLNEADKERIQHAVEKVLQEYGDVIRKLGRE